MGIPHGGPEAGGYTGGLQEGVTGGVPVWLSGVCVSGCGLLGVPGGGGLASHCGYRAAVDMWWVLDGDGGRGFFGSV